MLIGVPLETAAGEKRVATVPEVVEKLIKLGNEFGFDELLCWTRIGGLENDKVLRAMELLGTDIIPAVRKATGVKAAA